MSISAESTGAPHSMVGNLAATVRRWWRVLIPQGRFVRQVQTLLTGTVAAQGILILATPLLARLYTPVEFGLLALFTAAFGVITQASTGRLDAAIVLSGDDLEAIHVTLASLLVSVVASSVIAIALALSGGSLAAAADTTASGPWYWWVPPAVALGAWQLIGLRWHARKQRFKMISASNIAYVGGMVSVQLAGAALPASWRGDALMGGTVAGLLLSVMLLSADFGQDLLTHRRAVSWRATLAALRRYQNFLWYSTPQAFVAQLNQQAPRFLLKLFFPAPVLGTYTLCLRVLMAPIVMLNNAIRNVLLQRMSQARARPGESRRLVLMLSSRLFLMMLPFCLVFAIWADKIFVVLLGSQWTSAGQYARLLLPLVLAHAVVGSLRIAFQAMEEQFTIFLQDALNLALSALGLYVGYACGSAALAIFACSLATAAMYGLNLATILYKLGLQDHARQADEGQKAMMKAAQA